MDDQTDETRIQKLILEFGKLYSSMNFRKVQDLGMHPGHLHVLRTVGSREGISQREIADQLHIKPPTVAVTVRRMEKSGLIFRKESEADLRISRIFLSEKGKRIYQETEDLICKNEKTLLRGLSQDEINCLEKCLKQMMKNMEAARRQDPNGKAAESSVTEKRTHVNSRR